jgi:nicotinamidase-related amidase
MKHPNTIGHEATGLLIIDVQEKFAPAMANFEQLVENVVRLTLTFQMFNMPILITEQYPKGLGPTVSVIRKQFELVDIVDKLHFSCLREGRFSDQFAPLKLSSVVVCGVESHVCVNQTVHDLLQLGIKVHVVADAMSSRKSFDHDIALQKMIQSGAVPATTEMVLFELAQRAGTQSFKNIQHMIKHGLKRSAIVESAPSQPQGPAQPPAPAAPAPQHTPQPLEQPVATALAAAATVELLQETPLVAQSQAQPLIDAVDESRTDELSDALSALDGLIEDEGKQGSDEDALVQSQSDAEDDFLANEVEALLGSDNIQEDAELTSDSEDDDLDINLDGLDELLKS